MTDLARPDIAGICVVHARCGAPMRAAAPRCRAFLGNTPAQIG